MNAIDTAELRRLAEGAKYLYESTDELNAVDRILMQKWVEAANPAAILELLDMVEGMRNCQNCRNYPNHGSYGSYSGNTELCKNWQWEGE